MAASSTSSRPTRAMRKTSRAADTPGVAPRRTGPPAADQRTRPHRTARPTAPRPCAHHVLLPPALKARLPPSTGSIAPVTMAAASDARNTIGPRCPAPDRPCDRAGCPSARFLVTAAGSGCAIDEYLQAGRRGTGRAGSAFTPDAVPRPLDREFPGEADDAVLASPSSEVATAHPGGAAMELMLTMLPPRPRSCADRPHAHTGSSRSG